jgi:hypothetical protein
MPLAAVAKDGDRLVFEECEIGVVVVVNFGGQGEDLSVAKTI